MFIALPGLTLAIDEVAKFESVMETARKAIHDFINDEPNDLKIYEMEHPDVLLWAVWCIQQYAKMVSRDKCREKYGQLLEEIMEYLRRENHPNLFLHSNGLLYANGTEKAITWMNSTVNGHPVIPRTGYIVEINALWYNALCFVGELVGETGNNNLAETLQTLAEQTGKSFIDTFLNEYGYLLDYVDGNMMDWSVRPNMIFTVAFDYSPLDARQKKGVLDVVTKELLTPKGLRSLSPKSGGYNPNYVGPQMQRDYAYHQGTAWPWLAGFYFEAYLRIYKMSALGFIVPVLVLIITCTIGMLYVGGFFGADPSGSTEFAGDFIGAFGNTNAFVGLPWGGIISLVLIVIYLVARGVISFKDAMSCVPKGFIAMVPPIIILTLAVSLKTMTSNLGAAEFVRDLMYGASSGLYSLLPAVIFVVACILAFASGTSWGTFGILIPITTAIFPTSSELLIIGISACCAGAVCGDHCSPISDTTIMASAGAQVDHLTHVSTQLPYVITVAAVSFVTYVVAGFVQNALICIAVGAVLTIATLFVIRSIESKKAT